MRLRKKLLNSPPFCCNLILSRCLSICPSVCLSACEWVFESICLSVRLSVGISIYLSLRLSICLYRCSIVILAFFLFLASVNKSVWLFVYMPVHTFVPLSVCPSVSLSLTLLHSLCDNATICSSIYLSFALFICLIACSFARLSVSPFICKARTVNLFVWWSISLSSPVFLLFPYFFRPLVYPSVSLSVCLSVPLFVYPSVFVCKYAHFSVCSSVISLSAQLSAVPTSFSLHTFSSICLSFLPSSNYIDICSFVYLYIYSSVDLPTTTAIHLSLCLFTCLFPYHLFAFCLFICLCPSLNHSTFLSVNPFVFLSVHLFCSPFCLFICLCLTLHQSIFLSVNSSVLLSVHLFVPTPSIWLLSVHLSVSVHFCFPKSSISLFFCSFVCLYIHPSSVSCQFICLSLQPSVCLFVCSSVLYLYPSVCLLVCLSLCLSVFESCLFVYIRDFEFACLGLTWKKGLSIKWHEIYCLRQRRTKETNLFWVILTGWFTFKGEKELKSAQNCHFCV